MSGRTGYAVEDDGLIQQWFLCDSDGDDNNDEDLIKLSSMFPSATQCLSSTPMAERKLGFSTCGDENMDSTCDSGVRSIIDNTGSVNKLMTKPPKDLAHTPPYRKVRALRLFNSPQSPKTLLIQSEIPNSDGSKVTQIVVAPIVVTPKPAPPVRKHRSDPLRRPLFSEPDHRPHQSPMKLEANINPFYKNELNPYPCGKRRRDSISDWSTINSSSELNVSDEDAADKPWKQRKIKNFGEECLSRYDTDFYELGQIGSGEFGSVFKCINRMDGCVYAIKKSRNPIAAGTVNEKIALKEVYAHAVLGQYKHVVRYYSAWSENGHMLIQNEFCDDGSLAVLIEEKRKQKLCFTETEVKHILLHVGLGLRYIHNLNLAHMDIKPANIFITRKSSSSHSPNSSDDGFEDGDFFDDEFIYKIGDLGHVTSLSSPEVEEGDCRYMAPEILQDDHRFLAKADIFALGLTILEVCWGQPLPKNGDDWQLIRKGTLPSIPEYSRELYDLIKEMTHTEPNRRPTSAALVLSETLVPYASKTKEQLNNELNAEKLKNYLLSKQLQEAEKSIEKKSTKRGSRSRLIGMKTNRSHSVTNF